MTFLLDDFVAVPLTIVLYVSSARLSAGSAWLEPLSRIGDYEANVDPSAGGRPRSSNCRRLGRWAAQVVHWICCAMAVRAVETGLLLLLISPLMRIANSLGWWACTQEQVTAKQWVNLMGVPIALDAVQFACQNYFFDGRKTKKSTPSPS